MFLGKTKRAVVGFTLVELGIVVAIAAILVSFAISTGAMVFASNRAGAEVSELSDVTTRIQRVAWNHPDFTGMTQDTLIGLGVFPATQVVGNKLVNRWSGEVTAAPAAIVGAADGLALSSDMVPSADCPFVIESVDKLMRVIQVGSVVVKANGQLAADPAKLSAACSAGSTVKITFIIGK